jgi:dinuclear metal center YbgI/SA1388 family protein
MPVPLSRVVELLEQLAPLALAEAWDNVGLLVEPTRLSRDRSGVSRVLCTIDLAPAVLAEALELGVELVVAYHPPLFKGVKRLRAGAPGERTLLEAIERGIAIYSPHTALDAAPGGVNDWLVEALGPGSRGFIAPSPVEGAGQGRTLQLAAPASLDELCDRIRLHLNLTQLRVAAAPAHRQGAPIVTAAVCAGSGGALFERLSGVDLYLTGEMRHHDVLAKIAAGASVVLCDHTNTERGYLPRLAETLRARSAGALEVFVSKLDRDPLEIR